MASEINLLQLLCCILHLPQHLHQTLGYVFSGQVAGLLVTGYKYDANNVMEVNVVFDPFSRK